MTLDKQNRVRFTYCGTRYTLTKRGLSAQNFPGLTFMDLFWSEEGRGKLGQAIKTLDHPKEKPCTT